MAWAGALLLAAVVGGAACAGQPDSPSASLSVGSAGASYALASVDGQKLPATAYFGVDVSVTAQGGTLTLSSDGTYALSVSYNRHFASGNRDVPFTQAEQGRWSMSGSVLTLTPTGGTPHKAAISGSQLSLDLTVEDSSPPERATKMYTFTRTQ
jgi:hypothetical protein